MPSKPRPTSAMKRAVTEADVPHNDPVVCPGTAKTKLALINHGLAEDCGGMLIRLTNQGRAYAGSIREGTTDKRPRLLSYEGFDTRFVHSFGPREHWKLQEDPDCFNGQVRARRYRITIEAIEEDDDVVFERMQEMFDETNNMHTRDALMHHAKEHMGRPMDWERRWKQSD